MPGFHGIVFPPSTAIINSQTIVASNRTKDSRPKNATLDLHLVLV